MGDGPAPYRWLCLDHVRAFNAGYNYFDGLSPDEIHAAQSPLAGWEKDLVRGGRMEALEGDWNPQRIVVLKFQDLAAARAYYESETYTQARKVREGAGSIRMLAVEGV